MNRTHEHRPKSFTPFDYEKSFREGRLSVAQAAAMRSSSSSTQSPAPGLSNSTSSKPVDPAPIPSPASAPASAPSSNLQPQSSELRCSYSSSDGRRCRMFRAADHPELCHHHARQQLRALERTPLEPLAAEILGPIRDFRTAAAINAALGNMFVQLADGRLDARRAAVLTYMAQLMHQTLKRVGWEQIDRQPAPNLQAALATVLKAAKPKTKADKRAHAALSAVVLSHDPGCAQ